MTHVMRFFGRKSNLPYKTPHDIARDAILDEGLLALKILDNSFEAGEITSEQHAESTSRRKNKLQEDLKGIEENPEDYLFMYARPI